MDSVLDYNQFSLAILEGMAHSQPAHASVLPISAFTHSVISYFLASAEPTQSQTTELSKKARDIAKALGVDHLNSQQKITKVFQILHSEKVSASKRTLTDEEFQVFRRAVGNRNYDRAFKLLLEAFQNSRGQKLTNIAVAAYMLGNIKGAAPLYQEYFLQKQN